MIEGLKSLFSGDDVFHRQLTLFSICGIVGLFEAFVNSGAATSPLQKAAYIVVAILFALFYTGYETIFMHERELPDIDMRAIKLVFTKILFFIFLVGIPLFYLKFFMNKWQIAFALEMFLAVPLTMLQAGFSYNYQNSNAVNFLKKLNLNDYIILFFKRLLVLICGYLLVFAIVFVIFFIAGMMLALLYRGDMNSIALLLSSQQFAISRLSGLIAGVLLVYVLTLGCMAWDYELIKTYEREV